MEKRASGFLVLLLGVVIGASGGSLITYHATRAQVQTAEVEQDISHQIVPERDSNTALNLVEAPDLVESVSTHIEPSSSTLPAFMQPVLSDEHYEENDVTDESSAAYTDSSNAANEEPAIVRDSQESSLRADIDTQESYDPYERLLSPTESNKVFNHFQERYAEFAKQEKTDEHAHIAQSFQDYFDIYVVSEDAQLDKAECRVNACELRISSPNTSFSVPGKVFDIVKELDIKAKGMQGVDSYDVELERKIYMLLIEMEEFEG